jgi:hydrogenase maturation factor
MKTGKVSEAILNRSVLKEIKYQKDCVVQACADGSDASVIRFSQEELVIASNPVTLPAKTPAVLGISRVINDVAAKGGVPEIITAVLLLPTGYTEKNLKCLMREIDGCCRQHEVALAAGHTEVTPLVNAPCVVFTCVGSKKYQVKLSVQPDQDIYMIGAAGMEGACVLAQLKKQEILERYSTAFYEKCCVDTEELFLEKTMYTLYEHGTSYVHNLSTGGVLNGLWELAAFGNVGLEVDLKAIPVRQEIIELCELFELNPYQMASGGSLLMTIDRSCDIVNILDKKGITAYRIGKTTSSNNRIIVNEDELRYLEEPKPDELLQIF